MKHLVVIVSLLGFSTPALALHELNCSNGNGSIKRTEEEIWGANKVKYQVGQKVYDESEVNVQWRQKKVLARSGSPASAQEGTETYTVVMALSLLNGELLEAPNPPTNPLDEMIPPAKSISAHVICDSWWNSFLD